MASAKLQTTIKDKKIAIMGSGFIGSSWAMLFAAGGYNVALYDIEESQIKIAMDRILVQLENLKAKDLMKGTLSVSEQYQLISGTTSLKECLSSAIYVQECIPEKFDLKKQLFSKIDELVDDKAILASSTSFMPISTFTQEIKHRSQCIVTHPCNPPFYLPVMEVVPAPYTNPEITTKTIALLKEIDMSPVLIKKEVKGFVLNRMQLAIVAECWRLIEDDVISIEDLDTIMTDGLGMRYALIGPMETIHLNAEGIVNYCDTYGKAVGEICQDFGPVPKLEGEYGKKMEEKMVKTIPLDQLIERRKQRDTRLAALAKFKKDLAKNE